MEQLAKGWPKLDCWKSELEWIQVLLGQTLSHEKDPDFFALSAVTILNYPSSFEGKFLALKKHRAPADIGFVRWSASRKSQ
eukprot:scaffold17792_cov16-Tisochrysis_lutea.AAC.1